MEDTVSGSVAPRSVDPGRGIAWWTEAWGLFTKNAGMWIVLALVLIVIVVVLSFIPVLGTLAASLLLPVFMGSWLLAARKVEGGGTLALNDLFACFQPQYLNPLVVVGALLAVALVVIGLLAGGLGAGAVFGMAMGGAHRSVGGVAMGMGAGMLAVLISLALGFLVSMALWFAPALVVFRGVAPVDAIKASFAASLKNFVAFLLFGVVYLIASVVASIPFGLGWVILVPVLLLTAYTSAKDVFAV